VFLPVEQAARHAADIHAVDVIDTGVVNGVERGLDEEIAQGAVPQLAEADNADADDGNVSHGRCLRGHSLVILPRNLA